MRSSRRNLLDKVLEYSFACIELNLYLDNNPEDKNALNSYNQYSDKYAQARYDYEIKYGPLTNFGYSPSNYPWRWVCGYWPWDNEFYE
ncbi:MULTISPECIES: spore coat protein CotJB [Romboutsia]|uniref:spore coat protein CotJB n=1 Tax=Romboutsia TaxID=1501226 RepID=UPI00189BC5CC|nr:MULTISPECIES: spore coat protein CotJB [Romboutsia]MCH1960169.1 spore coat protein CotJB [Romboutsia hominis]MCH1969396.1 spore coat protein CotJB [Romboutsia hominis]MDB8804911.1 spore coat protein CotJB [Romboutsia sp. 1001216sp1]MDB8808543.1 spore coat protein CotJB [Romboutsia sp. 1001216sp1]MDB8810556.1 spore coat protein CotJB [Romboutsia sp. 1001216sp1]